jgi:adenylosuccinate synthase
MIVYSDVIVDIQAGDTGKGKVCHALSKIKGEYTHIIRYNGGGNAGHTIYVDGQKVVTHFIPSGIVNGIKSIIGPGCVVNVESLMREINDLESKGFQVKGNLFIDKRVHLITEYHLLEDGQDTEIGTTKTGNGPAYRDKYYRKGQRAESSEVLKEYVIDIYKELHGFNPCKILFEGAQGFELDVDWGDYPYVTSSHCTVGSAVLNGVPPQSIRKVYGVAKAYNTYVGAKKFEESSEIFDKIREIGNEYGSTTGRPRQIAWTNIDNLIRACNINGVTNLIINKMDVLRDAGQLTIVVGGIPETFSGIDFLESYIRDILIKNCRLLSKVQFSYSPDKVVFDTF